MKWKCGVAVILATTVFFYYSSLVSFYPVIFDQSIYLHKVSLSSNQSDGFAPLPQSVIDQVKYFVYFVGRAHSGHSIVGSILDSHPHMILAHEAKIFIQLKQNPTHFTSKAAIFNELWSNSYNASHYSGGLRNSDSRDIKNKGYTLQVGGLHQGTYSSYIDVIGDKNGGNTVSLFHRNPSEWEKIFNKLQTLVNIPFKVIYVIRNPYDNIASAQLYHSNNMSIIRNSNGTFVLDNNMHKSFVHQIDRHFASHQTIMDAKKKYSFDLLEVHVKDLVDHPNVIITKMCDFLGVHCSNSYIQGCNKSLFKNESKVRYKIRWTVDLISRIKSYILKHDNLVRYYSFNS